MKYLIGIDLGTGGARALLISEKGDIVASSVQNYPLYHPHNGWAEQDPGDWREAVLVSLADVVAKSGVPAEQITGIGLSGQMHGLVMLDEVGRPLGSSIIWSDQRTEKQVLEMEALLPREKWLEITANPPIAAWTAAKIMWARENDPECFARCRHILLPKDYIRYVLTGEFATDVSDASGMQLMNVKKRRWSETVLDALDIERALLPRVHESTAPTGALLPQIAERCGLTEYTVVAAGASDNAAAAIGTGVVHSGQAFITIGTSAVIYTHLEEYVTIPAGQLHVCCSAVPGCWHTMGGPQAAGLSFNWFLKNFCLEYKQEAKEAGISPFQVTDEAIAAIAPGSEHLVYMPFLMGERTPHMDPNCRGVFFGLNAIHGKAHLLRAIMEGIAYSLADCNNILKAAGSHVTALRACGGGSRSGIWLQIIADLLACDITTLEQDEGPALGAALLAGVAAGTIPDVRTACDKLIVPKRTIHTNPENTPVYEEYQRFYNQLYQHVKDDFTALQSLR